MEILTFTNIVAFCIGALASHAQRDLTSLREAFWFGVFCGFALLYVGTWYGIASFIAGIVVTPVIESGLIHVTGWIVSFLGHDDDDEGDDDSSTPAK